MTPLEAALAIVDIQTKTIEDYKQLLNEVLNQLPTSLQKCNYYDRSLKITVDIHNQIKELRTQFNS